MFRDQRIDHLFWKVKNLTSTSPMWQRDARVFGQIWICSDTLIKAQLRWDIHNTACRSWFRHGVCSCKCFQLPALDTEKSYSEAFHFQQLNLSLRQSILVEFMLLILCAGWSTLYNLPNLIGWIIRLGSQYIDLPYKENHWSNEFQRIIFKDNDFFSTVIISFKLSFWQ